MSYHSLTVQPVNGNFVNVPFTQQLPLSLFAMFAFSVDTIQRSKRDFNRMKRRFLWTSFKIKMRDLLKYTMGR